MAKLYFRYGSVSSAKTLNLLAVAHAYRQQGKIVKLLKPAIDTRFGAGHIRSRAGFEDQADLVVDADAVLNHDFFGDCHCVLVDEAQFLSPAVVEQLRNIASDLGVPVICYGLRGDFRTRLFPGSLRLMELADAIEEIKTTCYYCNAKALFNLKLVDGKATISGPTIDLGTEEKYHPACPRCYSERIARDHPQKIESPEARIH